MPFEFVPLKNSEQADLISFLANSFQADPGLVSFRPDVIDWKYFAPHPEWSGVRSYVVKQEGKIVAHGGLWPVRLKNSDREVKAVHLIDWAASRGAVGAGVFLLRKLAALADVMLTVGGSEDTRNVLPKLGYKPRGELRYYARVVRPWQHLRTTPQKNWKLPLKAGRAFVQRLKTIPKAPPGWQAEKIATFSGVNGTAFSNTCDFISSIRTWDGIERFLACPAAEFSAFLVRQGGESCGYFLLTRIGHQVRVSDIRLSTCDRETWESACRIAVNTAAEDAEAAEIVVAASVPLIQEVWSKAGFTHRKTDSILCYDPAHLLPAGPIDLSLADGDLCFLSDPQFPYLL